MLLVYEIIKREVHWVEENKNKEISNVDEIEEEQEVEVMDNNDEKDSIIEKLKKKLSNKISVELHPEISAIKMENTDQGTRAELYGMKLSSNSSVNNDTKKKQNVYDEMIISIKEMLSKEGNSEETNDKLIDLLDKIRIDIKELETTKKEKKSNDIANVIKLVGCSVVATGVGIGSWFLGKEVLKKMEEEKEIEK